MSFQNEYVSVEYQKSLTIVKKPHGKIFRGFNKNKSSYLFRVVLVVKSIRAMIVEKTK
jgi:hypothetical protein